MYVSSHAHKNIYTHIHISHCELPNLTFAHSSLYIFFYFFFLFLLFTQKKIRGKFQFFDFCSFESEKLCCKSCVFSLLQSKKACCGGASAVRALHSHSDLFWLFLWG